MSCYLKIISIVAVAAAFVSSETPVPETSFSEAVKQEKETPSTLAQTKFVWPKSDGFMSMAHMVNSEGSVKWAKGDYANAVEVDVAFCGVRPCQMRHSAPEVDGKPAGGCTFSGKVNPTPGMACDCSCYNGATIGFAGRQRNVCGHLYKDKTVGTGGVGCQAYTPFVKYLNYIAKKNHFRMLYLDNKVAAGWNKAQQIAAGGNEARIVIEELFEKGYTGKLMFDGATRDFKHFIQSAIHEFGTYKGGKFFKQVYFTYGFIDYNGKVWKQQRMVRYAIKAMREDFCTNVNHHTTGDATEVVDKCAGWTCPLVGQYCKEGYTCGQHHKWVKVTLPKSVFSTRTHNGDKWKNWDKVELLRGENPQRSDIKRWKSRRLLGRGNIGDLGKRCTFGKQANIFYSIGISACAPATHYHMIKQAIHDKSAGGLSYVLVWTIDKLSSMAEYIKLGVDGIMTNYPTRATYMAKKSHKQMMRL